jgi:hypothetical protein
MEETRISPELLETEAIKPGLDNRIWIDFPASPLEKI